ncbi:MULTISPECIES: MarR family winged helix-turn-helix transcriptional regulator [Saccharopolyspora]|uniref:MarR family transcriptional regulator n=1 Tax=Saccharopolyspora gregorii TaxID=33914 RepID=A0ABP6RJI7_9PSEU|nr:MULTISPECIES: MarR family transcriptional regulator [Saccharopolyspora]MCA1188470.1 MarR family transcriptional regulator [Saccharopolyspora sp. 6T]MCA1190794.1 MarR family transcriptional regulator [Saccharopolyspora sp. 6V]MCA1226946.1 MarR family transcriptional regulator [Saccharopolyspora sp. 6M]MCA1282151.1 MarR family transcriptional regulator [Saccharopolyspora sp. 7B]
MSADSALSLDQQVCFALYSASRSFTNLYRPFLDELGLTYPQYLVMLVLWEHDSLAVKDLGAMLKLDSGTLSPLLKRLEASGLVDRRRSTRDERSVEIGLTERGRELRQHAEQIPNRVLAASGMELEEVLALRSTLHRLTANVDQAAHRARAAVADGVPITDELLRGTTTQGD